MFHPGLYFHKPYYSVWLCCGETASDTVGCKHQAAFDGALAEDATDPTVQQATKVQEHLGTTGQGTAGALLVSGRPTSGDRIKMIAGDYKGKFGQISRDDHDGSPYKVRLDGESSERSYFNESQVSKYREIALTECVENGMFHPGQWETKRNRCALGYLCLIKVSD